MRCSVNMHHVWVPKRKELAEELLANGKAEQTCRFCPQKRLIKNKNPPGEMDSSSDDGED